MWDSVLRVIRTVTTQITFAGTASIGQVTAYSCYAFIAVLGLGFISDKLMEGKQEWRRLQILISTFMYNITRIT